MSFTTAIKRLIYPLYIYPKTTKGWKAKLLDTNFVNDDIALQNLKLFSNRNEDGIILKLITALNIKNGYFIDIGSNDCINSNCANLAFNLNWNGVFIDADKSLLKIGERNYKLFKSDSKFKFVEAFLYPKNINEIVIKNIDKNTEVDFVSIDIDGNDYAIWKALDCIKPKIVVVENKIEYGKYDIIIPITDKFGQQEWGASIVSFTKLASQKDYTLVATNDAGFNAFYLRNDLLENSSIKLLKLESVLENTFISKDFYSAKIMNTLLEKI